MPVRKHELPSGLPEPGSRLVRTRNRRSGETRPTPRLYAGANGLFLYAANADSPLHAKAKTFFADCTAGDREFVICGLVLVETYMQLRNPAVLRKPLTASKAAAFCHQLRANPKWQHIDFDPAVSSALWRWARSTKAGFRQIIDARLALTLRHHGVDQFATANVKHFQGFGFAKVWNPCA